jgi:hypothetical protein
MTFRVTKDNRHDIKEAENLPCKFRGTATGYEGYWFRKVKKRLAESDLRLIAHARKNIRQENTEEEKSLLRRRNLVKRAMGKLRWLFSDSFS